MGDFLQVGSVIVHIPPYQNYEKTMSNVFLILTSLSDSSALSFIHCLRCLSSHLLSVCLSASATFGHLHGSLSFYLLSSDLVYLCIPVFCGCLTV